MNAQHSAENLTIHHKVKDYATWRKGYDEHEKSRNSAGVTNGKVFRSAEDPNDIPDPSGCGRRGEGARLAWREPI